MHDKRVTNLSENVDIGVVLACIKPEPGHISAFVAAVLTKLQVFHLDI